MSGVPSLPALVATEPAPGALHAAVDAFFADGGPLSRRLPGYRARAPQLEMAHLVAECLVTARGRLAVEAGTGTGKSFAYLAAALLAGKRVVVATGTKALQDQLYTKDVPLVLACARDLFGTSDPVDDSAVLMKGRQNYLCKLRYERFQMQPTFAFAHEAQAFVQITRWAGATSTGDRAELSTLPEPYATWSDLDAGGETCIGVKCQHYEACFVVRMRRSAEAAQLVVANHHLLCADLRLRLESRRGGDGQAHVLPDADAFILDEAHGLADVASDHFAVQVGSVGLARLLGDVRRFADGLGGDERAELLDGALDAEDRVAAAFAPLQSTGRERTRLKLVQDGARLRDSALLALRAIEQTLGDLEDEGARGTRDAAAGDPQAVLRQAERDALRSRVEAAHAELGFVLGHALDDPGFVVMTEPTRRGALVTAAPVDVAAALHGTLFSVDEPVVLTSATLAVAGDMGPSLRRMGALRPTRASEASASEGRASEGHAAESSASESSASEGSAPEITVQRILPSPFDAARQAALYCPTLMPAPNAPEYGARFVEEAEFLLETTRGGALFLFTSTAAMDEGHAALLPKARALGIPVFKQGEMQKAKLLDQLRAHDGEIGALLCATRSFWEGVDVRGRALRLVVVDRLPFDVPTDPLRQARAELCRARGGDPFQDETLPDAALALKQGAGRLLRDVRDAGIIAVLDGRLRTKRYGRVFLETLPPVTRIGGRPALLEFWARFVRPCLGLDGASE